MSSSLQTIVAFAVVALAVAYLAWSYFRKGSSSGCGANCGAVSPEIKKLQAKLKQHRN